MNKSLVILTAYFQALRRMRFTKCRLQRWQTKRKNQIYCFAKTHSQFYRDNIGSLIDKKVMMEHFSKLNTRQIDREKAFAAAFLAEQRRHFDALLDGITVGLSSGTSGNRGIFLASERERLIWCGNILAKTLPKPPWKQQKIALFLRANSTLYKTISSKKRSFAYFDLLEDWESLKKKVSSFDPDVLVAPPSALALLIGVCHPTRVISIAETLLSADQKYLEKGFGQKIFQIYQATEGFLGFTCSHGTIHLNEDLILVEKESIGHKLFIPIITDLFRQTQPIIRYRLDDVLKEKTTPCLCGCPFQAIERIEGRCDDLLYVSMECGREKPLFPDFISRAIITASCDLQDYQVVQTKKNHWTVFVERPFRKKVKQALADLFQRLRCIPPEVTFSDEPSDHKARG